MRFILDEPRQKEMVVHHFLSNSFSSSCPCSDCTGFHKFELHVEEGMGMGGGVHRKLRRKGGGAKLDNLSRGHV